MHCYYQGELRVTGGDINDVERVATTHIEEWVQIEKDRENPDAIIVDFSDTDAISEYNIREFVAEAAKHGWIVNGTVPYYGDYEGSMVITDNVIEEFSSEEMAIRTYMESPSVTKETAIADKAVSVATYLFLRLVFSKEDYPETVVENMEWIAEELLSNEPTEILLRNLKHELQEGDYGKRMDIVSSRLTEYFAFNEVECEKLSSQLLHWMSAEMV